MTQGQVANAAPRRNGLVLVMIIGLVLIVAGGITLALAQAAQVAFASDRAEVPGTLEFEAKEGRYRVLLLADPLLLRKPYVTNAEAYFECVIDHPNGSTTVIDTGNALSRLETDVGIELASFEAVPGTTSVTCAWKDGRESSSYYYSVARTSPVVTILGGVAVGLGVVALGLSLAMWARARGRAITNKRPLS